VTKKTATYQQNPKVALIKKKARLFYFSLEKFITPGFKGFYLLVLLPENIIQTGQFWHPQDYTNLHYE
jgi:hypothetical protein